jgi:hypothetical protein
MAVKQLVPDEDWNEEYRQRRWLPAREAAVFLKQRDLGQMVLALEQQLTS